MSPLSPCTLPVCFMSVLSPYDARCCTLSVVRYRPLYEGPPPTITGGYIVAYGGWLLRIITYIMHKTPPWDLLTLVMKLSLSYVRHIWQGDPGIDPHLHFMLSGNNTHSTPSGPIAHIGEGGTGYGTNTATTNTATTAATAAKASGYNNYNANYSNGSYSNGSYNGGYSNYGSYNNRYSNYERQQLRHQYGNDGNDGSYNDNGYGNNGRTTAANQHSSSS